MTSHYVKMPFITFAPEVYVLIFLKTFFMYAWPLPVQTELHFFKKKMQFLAVAYDMGILSCAFDIV